MIDLSRDPQVTDALLSWRGREVWPTDLGSAELRAVAVEVRRRAVFSARTTSAAYLAEVQAVLDDMLSGKINLATGRLRLMRKLKQLGYTPAKGFPGADAAAVPPAEEGSLQDLSSERRIDLVLETNQRMAASYGQMVTGNQPQARWAFPAWELVRLYVRQVPRGTPESHTAGWPKRWQEAGESVSWEGAAQARMIALKDSPIWAALGDGAGGHEDTLHNPYPPFAFRSGMAWRAVPRAECDRLGLLQPGQTPAPQKAELAPNLREFKAYLDQMTPEERRELEEELKPA